MLLESYSDCGLSIKLFWIFWQVQFLRTKYRVLDIEVDGGVGTLTIEAAAQVANDTVTALMFIQYNYCQRNEKMVYAIYSGKCPNSGLQAQTLPKSLLF